MIKSTKAKEALLAFSENIYIERDETAFNRRALYRDDWVLFVREVLGVNPYPYQVEIIQTLQRERRLAVKALRGVGKTTVAAWIILAVVTLYGDEFDSTQDVKVVTTAGNHRQLKQYLWPEIHKWAKVGNWSLIDIRLRVNEELLSMGINLGTRRAFAASPDRPEGIEGAHAETLLLVVDEAKIASPDIFDAMEGAFSSITEGQEAFVLAISTPGAPTGRFYDIVKGKEGYEDWAVYNVTYEQAVAAGRINVDWAEQRKRQWGKDDPRYQNQVLGNFADSSEYSVYKLSWLERAQENWYARRDEKREGLLAFGCDPADTGVDLTALAKWVGSYCEWVKTWDEEVMRTVPIIQREVGAVTNAPIGIDALSVGAGAYQVLRDKKYKVVPIRASASAVDRAGQKLKDAYRINEFQNLRSAMFWQLRDALDPNSPVYADIALPPDPALIEELLAHEWEERQGKIYVLSKDRVKEQIARSPDKADALVMGWHVQGRNRRRATARRL